jgi:hypothetical protein
MDTKKIGIFIAVILVMSVFAAMPVIAKDKAPTPGGSADIAINNGIINIDAFGENQSRFDVWIFNGYSTVHEEYPLMSYGANDPVYLGSGTVHQTYPATGNPDVWYDAIVGLDLDVDIEDDINVTRSIMVPSGQKYFFVRYCIENINESKDLGNFSFFQGVDYDLGTDWNDDEGGYADDFVWVQDVDVNTRVGFSGDIPSDHHSVGYSDDTWNDLETGSLNDANYYYGDPGVGMQWDLGTLNASDTICLNVTFFFEDQKQAPALTPIGLIALLGLLSIVAAISMKKRKE